jgi:hemoglobin
MDVVEGAIVFQLYRGLGIPIFPAYNSGNTVRRDPETCGLGNHSTNFWETGAMAQTLFEKYGGFAKISRIVLALYDRLLDDETIGPYFDNVDMARIVDHQTKFLSSLLGGPASFSDKHIEHVHKHLAISEGDFDVLKDILRTTLSEHGLTPDDVDLVTKAFEQRRTLVVG